MFDPTEFEKRRQRLYEAMVDNSIAIVAANPEQRRSGDTYHRYRQNSHFYYLTGFSEPQALMVLIKESAESCQYLMFNRPRDEKQEIWDGLRAGQAGVCRDYGVERAYPIEQVDEVLPQLLSDKHTVYYCQGERPELDKRITRWHGAVKRRARTGVKAPQEFIDLSCLLDEMRLIKSEAEIKVMRQVAKISAQAHTKAMQACQDLTHEYQLEAVLTQQFMHHGCRGPAYDCIVGSGTNACILHYTENNAQLTSGDLILIDAGGELFNYAADITRTFPISGRFSLEQASIYQVVLDAQKAGIACIKPGIPWSQIQQTIVTVLTQGLCELGILKGSVSDLIETQAYRQFYMHNSGHWLGLDVHDVGDYKVNGLWRNLEAGMVLTVEPGIYIQADSPEVEKRWRGIGVRIEDDILVTANGYEVLTQDAAKEINDIERLMA